MTQAAKALPQGTLWKVRIAAILWALAIGGCFLALPVVIDAAGPLAVILVVLAVLFGAAVAWIARKLGSPPDHGFVHDWLKCALAALCILCIAIAAPIYYFAMRTAVDPPLLPRAVLSNGEKTVVFQGMMHIGTQDFYKQVVYDAEQALADGYVLFYEGVQPNPQGDRWFSETLAGGGDLSANYTALSKMCGLKFQSDYFGLLEADRAERPERHVVADVDTWQMQQEYERLKREDPVFAASVDGEIAAKNVGDGGAMASPVSALDSLTDGQLKLMGYFCRDQASNVIREEKAPTELGKVIVDFRNRNLVDRIVAEPHDKIYITYGADHLRGIFPMLRQIDPRWRVESVTWSQPVAAPTRLEGELRID